MGQTKRIRHRRKGASLLPLAIVLLIAGVIAIFAPVVITEMELNLDTEAYEQLKTQSRMTNTASATGQTLEIALGSEPIPSVTGRTGVDLMALKAENEDFIAWLQIPGTTIDYPVVSTNSTKYYLGHTFSGKKSYLGTLLSLEKSDYQTPGKNIAIYGHHIRSNSEIMFSPLISYKEQSFFEDHKTVYLDSLYHSDIYTVFAVVNMRSGDWDPSDTNFATEDDFLVYVQRAKSLSLYDTGVDVAAGDQILTLVTCDRSYIPTYGRLLVMAVRQPNY